MASQTFLTKQSGVLERMQKYGLWVCLLLLGNASIAQQTTRLKVSATIPPRACEYPDRCERVATSAPTMVSVDKGVVYYIGSTPSVTQKDDLLIVIF